jgi:(p)ppGpp synthase/HD superfamily hydrolase
MGLLGGTELIAAAYAIADEAHSGAMYDVSVPYIEHPKKVARLAADLDYPPEVIAACWLHDVVEDTPFTETDLEQRGMPLVVIEGVMAVTYIDGQESLEKIDKARSHLIGHVVKFFDSSINFANNIEDLRAVPGDRGFEYMLRYAGYIGRLAADLPTPQDIRDYLATA